MNIYPVIMAGGSGTRFWPLSRKTSPKQFLPIISRKTMIEETVQRLLPRIDPDRIHTVANRDQTKVIRELLPEVPPDNCLIEPLGRNTAPSLLLASAAVSLKDPEAVIAALPADHLILDPDRFLDKLEAGGKAARDGSWLVTFGIPPAYAATGYGYIQIRNATLPDIHEEPFYIVEAFKEKPDQETARAFLEAGHYFWNSGMFLWRASVLAEKLERHAPDWYAFWGEIRDILDGAGPAELEDLFRRMPSQSIDYALMEHSSGVVMAKGDFGWSDVGAWSALFDVWAGDSEGNALRGEALTLETRNCLVYNPEKLTALIGVRDLIVVDTPDVLLVCRADRDQNVKNIVELIHKKGWTTYL